MLQFEQVTDKEGLSFAKEINALYKRISAKETSGGIDELFKSIGKKVLELKIENKGEKMMLDKNNQINKNNVICC